MEGRILTAFDTAWALVKMPYHGTDAGSAEKIMRLGTRAFKDKRRSFRRDPAQFWMVDNEKEARRHAEKQAVRTGLAPTVLYITDEGVASVPTRSWRNGPMGQYTTHKHPHRIDPQHISIHDQGPEPDEPYPNVNWENWDDMQEAIRDMEYDPAMELYDEWERNTSIRDQMRPKYRKKLKDWRGEL